jgi:hypothetical protein
MKETTTYRLKQDIIGNLKQSLHVFTNESKIKLLKELIFEFESIKREIEEDSDDEEDV